jgi:hypothetical protein
MAAKKEFSLLLEDYSLMPHRFVAFKNNPNQDNLREIAKQCVEAWRMKWPFTLLFLIQVFPPLR